MGATHAPSAPAPVPSPTARASPSPLRPSNSQLPWTNSTISIGIASGASIGSHPCILSAKAAQASLFLPDKSTRPSCLHAAAMAFFSAASNGTSAFSPVTPREPAAQPPPPKSAGPQSHRSILQLSPQSPEAELAQVAMRCVSLSDQLSSCKEQFFQNGIHLLKDVSSLPASR